jgi:hypothetical protein
VLSPDETAELLRSCWYSHDAQWFMAVAQEFGMEAANRVNRRAVRALGRTEVRRLARAGGIENPRAAHDIARLIELANGVLFPQPGMDIELTVIDEKSYKVAFRRCFVHEKISRAGIGPVYTCAVFDRLYGWHDELKVPLAGEAPALPCARFQGRECGRTLTIA